MSRVRIIVDIDHGGTGRLRREQDFDTAHATPAELGEAILSVAQEFDWVNSPERVLAEALRQAVCDKSGGLYGPLQHALAAFLPRE